MAEADGLQELQGFICPVCKTDQRAGEILLAHFREEHSEEQDLMKTLQLKTKDLIGKATKKILKPGTILPGSQGNNSTIYPEYQHAKQELGITVSHTKVYERIRTERNQRLYVPTNQLIIRLEKLLDNMPTDPLKKKLHEQNLVPWIDGSAVSRCPNCTGIFHLAKRQHHCRTCGGIMCNDCSHFMSIHTARKILDKPEPEKDSELDNGDHQLRLCVHCISLLEAREQIRSSQTIKPIISTLYDLLADSKRQADNHYTLYVRMCNSFKAGESSYNLQDAQVLRVKLLRLAESIDTISGKIASLGTKDPKNPPHEQALILQNAVRTAATAYLRGQLLNLPTLPTEEQLKEAQETRSKQKITMIEEKKKKQARYNSQGAPTSNQKPTGPAVFHGQGWVPEKKKGNMSDDPLIEQINIIESYIKEARDANKLDEVASLEANLQELKKEFRKKQTFSDDASRSGESSEAGSLGSYEEGRSYLENHHF